MEVKLSSRIGKIRKARKFPVFHARPLYRQGHCGHQHLTSDAAMNCAENRAMRHGAAWAAYAVDKNGSESQHGIVHVARTAEGPVVARES